MSDSEHANDGLQTQQIPVEEIYADPDMNCRGDIAPFDVIELSNSIKTHGLQQPITIQPRTTTVGDKTYKWRIVAGHRRHKAFVVLGWTFIPCIIKTNLTDVQVRVLNLQENIARKDLDIKQEAFALNKFKKAGYTIEEIAKLINMSKGYVQVRINLLELEPEIQEAAAAGFVTQEQIKDLYSLPNSEQRFAAVKAIKESRIKGEKRAIKIKQPKKNPTAKKVRGKEEIREMIDHIMDHLGPNLATRALAWCSGEISDLDLYRDIKEATQEIGKSYLMPEEALV